MLYISYRVLSRWIGERPGQSRHHAPAGGSAPTALRGAGHEIIWSVGSDVEHNGGVEYCVGPNDT